MNYNKFYCGLSYIHPGRNTHIPNKSFRNLFQQPLEHPVSSSPYLLK
jgi:hypothetical protein